MEVQVLSCPPSFALRRTFVSRKWKDAPRSFMRRVGQKPAKLRTAGHQEQIRQRGVEQWQLVGLITRRSEVRVLPPQPFFALAENALRSLGEEGRMTLHGPCSFLSL